MLLNRKNYYFVPFGQDNAEAKPTSLIADFRKIIPTAEAALEGRQIQPILLWKRKKGQEFPAFLRCNNNLRAIFVNAR